MRFPPKTLFSRGRTRARRDPGLDGLGIAPLHPGLENPLPWLAELMDIGKEQNFFEGRVTEYQKAGALALVSDDEL